MALIVGIDLGRKSAHDVILLRRETAQQLGRAFRFDTTLSGIDALFDRFDAVGPPDEAIAAALKNRGYPVYRPSSYRVRRMRQAGDRKNKSNQNVHCVMKMRSDHQHQAHKNVHIN